MLRKFKPQIFSILRILFFAYFGLLTVLFFNQSRMIYYPSQNVRITPKSIGIEFESIELNTSDGEKLSGWFIPASKQNPLGKATILYSHGNAGNISDRIQKLPIYRDLGVSVLLYDYRGYGKSSGSPSENGTYIDIETFWHYLVNEKKIPPAKIIAYGESLGGAVASYLAEKEPSIGGLILSATCTSIKDRAQELYSYLPISLISQFSYDTRSRLQNMNIPVLIFHSREDEVFPFSHAEANFQAISSPELKMLVELQGGHNDGFLESAEVYRNGLDKFINLVSDRFLHNAPTLN
jgi:uncharacterized protein